MSAYGIDPEWRRQSERRPKNDKAIYLCSSYLLSLTPKWKRIEMIRLHRLLYIALGFSLTKDRVPIFEDEVEAWVSGPIFPKLLALNEGEPWVGEAQLGTHVGIDRSAAKLLSQVFDVYGLRGLRDLDIICQGTGAWREAREYYRSTGSHVIPKECLKRHFGDAIKRQKGTP